MASSSRRAGLEIAAARGEAEAQCWLGHVYYYGDGAGRTSVLLRRRLQLYQQAAEQGDAKAQYQLGAMYMDGKSVEQDCNKAAQLFQLAAEQGNPDAQHYLGLLYHFGHGVEQDYSKAVELYQQSAEQGNADALRGLGTAFQRPGSEKPKKKSRRNRHKKKLQTASISA